MSDTEDTTVWPAPWGGQGQSTAPHPRPHSRVATWGRLNGLTPSLPSCRKQGRQQGQRRLGPPTLGPVPAESETLRRRPWGGDATGPSVRMATPAAGSEQKWDSDMSSQPGWEGMGLRGGGRNTGTASGSRENPFPLRRQVMQGSTKPLMILVQSPTAEGDAAPCARQLTDVTPPQKTTPPQKNPSPAWPRGPGPHLQAQHGQRRAGLAHQASVPPHTTRAAHSPSPNTSLLPGTTSHEQPGGPCLQRPMGGTGYLL